MPNYSGIRTSRKYPYFDDDSDCYCGEGAFDIDGLDYSFRMHRTCLRWFPEAPSMETDKHPYLSLCGEWWHDYKVKRDPAESGDWKLDNFTVPEWSGFMTQDQLSGRLVPPGTYSKLWQPGKALWMTDTPVEVADHIEFLQSAHGRVLINGLGLGMAPEHLLKEKECITHIDIVELNEDVIKLIAPYFEDYGDRVTIHHGDAYSITWPTGTTWDVAWHDIWPDIGPYNLPEMTKLMNRYSRKVRWQACWGWRECSALKKQEESWS